MLNIKIFSWYGINYQDVKNLNSRGQTSWKAETQRCDIRETCLLSFYCQVRALQIQRLLPIPRTLVLHRMRDKILCICIYHGCALKKCRYSQTVALCLPLCGCIPKIVADGKMDQFWPWLKKKVAKAKLQMINWAT